MLGAVFAPFVLSGVLAAIAAGIGMILVVVFFMLVDSTFARLVLWTTCGIILLTRFLSG